VGQTGGGGEARREGEVQKAKGRKKECVTYYSAEQLVILLMEYRIGHFKGEKDGREGSEEMLNAEGDDEGTELKKEISDPL